MKRYAIGPVELHKQGGMFGEEHYTICDLRVEEHSEGNWVKFEDVQQLRERIEQLPRYESDPTWGMEEDTDGMWIERADVLAILNSPEEK